MYWYRQRHEESMEQIVFLTTTIKPEFGQKFDQNKFAASKTVAESGNFTVKHVDYTDRGVYFCAVSMHSGLTVWQSCTKTQYTSTRNKQQTPKEGGVSQQISCLLASFFINHNSQWPHLFSKLLVAIRFNGAE